LEKRQTIGKESSYRLKIGRGTDASEKKPTGAGAEENKKSPQKTGEAYGRR